MHMHWHQIKTPFQQFLTIKSIIGINTCTLTPNENLIFNNKKAS